MQHNIDNTPRSDEKKNVKEMNSTRLTMAMHRIGDANTILAFLDLTSSTSFATNTFCNVEDICGLEERKVGQKSMREAIEKEASSDPTNNQGTMTNDGLKKLLTCSFDMAWQRRSSGRIYDSLSGHAFLVGGLTKKVVNAVVLCKKCKVCEIAKKQKKNCCEHICPINYQVTSKAMEASAALRLVTQCWENGFWVHQLVCDDDSSTRANLRHSWSALIRENKMRQEDWPRTPKGYRKKDCGMLPTQINAPIFLADPTHRVRSVSRHFFALADSTKSTCTKGDAMRMKRNMGCWLKQNRHKTFEEFRQSASAPLEHLFDAHSQCSIEWCTSKAGKEVNKGKYRCKIKDALLYTTMKEIWEKYTSDELLFESHHTYDSQTNEALNHSMACRAPKTRTFSLSLSLEHRMMVCIGEHNVGLQSYWSEVFSNLGITVDGSFHQYLVAMEW